MKLLEPVGQVVCEVAKAAWAAIETVTGFVWSLLIATLKNPVSWGVVTAAGARIAVGNALIGALVIGIGILGASYTLYYGTTQGHPHSA